MTGMSRIRTVLALSCGAALAATAAASGAFAQTSIVPATPYYAMNPASPLTPTANSPVQQQVLENYRSQLLQTQREQLQHNSSGLGAAQIQVTHQLNTYGAGYGMSAPPAPPPPGNAPSPSTTFNPVPFSSVGSLPQPPFDAAPPPSYPATPPQ